MEEAAAARMPGQLIEDSLARLGWTQRVLAVVTGLSEPSINRLVTGKRPITAEDAIVIGEVLSIEPETLLDLQKSFDLAQAKLVARSDPRRAIRAQLLGGFPVADMIKRGWIDAEAAHDVARVEAGLIKFFGVASVDDIPTISHAAKKTDALKAATGAQLAWLYRAKRIAEDTMAPRYTEAALRYVLRDLRPLMAASNAARKVPLMLMESGVRFIVVESLPGAKIDGATFWLGDEAPVIALSFRLDRIDNFWFVLRHEIEHVLRGHGRDGGMLDSDLDGNNVGWGEGIAEEERLANAAAAEFCIPQEAIDGFIRRKDPVFTERDLLGFAKTMGVHPGVVAGQLQHKTQRWNVFRKHLVKVRSVVAPTAIVDGWGDIYPLDD